MYLAKARKPRYHRLFQSMKNHVIKIHLKKNTEPNLQGRKPNMAVARQYKIVVWGPSTLNQKCYGHMMQSPSLVSKCSAHSDLFRNCDRFVSQQLTVPNFLFSAISTNSPLSILFNFIEITLKFCPFLENNAFLCFLSSLDRTVW